MRGRINITVLGVTGAPLAAASVQVNIRGGAAATLWSQETGGTNPANPLTTDAQGRVTAWVDRGAYDLIISGAGIATYTVNVEVTPGRDGAVDSTWIGAGVVQQAHIASGAVGNAQLAPGVGVPIGVSLDFNGPEASIPTGYLPEDGRAISRTTFATAFATLGTVHGVGDGSTTFNIPDGRGRTRIGKDDMGGAAAGRLAGSSMSGVATTLGGVGGEAAHALSVGELPSHGHTLTGVPGISDPTHTHASNITHNNGANSTSNVTDGAFGLTPLVLNNSGTGVTATLGTLAVANAGSGSAHNVVQPGRIVNSMIRVA